MKLFSKFWLITAVIGGIFMSGCIDIEENEYIYINNLSFCGIVKDPTNTIGINGFVTGAVTFTMKVTDTERANGTFELTGDGKLDSRGKACVSLKTGQMGNVEVRILSLRVDDLYATVGTDTISGIISSVERGFPYTVQRNRFESDYNSWSSTPEKAKIYMNPAVTANFEYNVTPDSPGMLAKVQDYLKLFKYLHKNRAPGKSSDRLKKAWATKIEESNQNTKRASAKAAI